MIVTLKREPKNLQTNLEGIYVLRTEIINGKSHWVHESELTAIWNGNNETSPFWMIGDLSDLGGSEIARVISADDVASPQEATTWQLRIDGSFVESNDILVDSFPGTGTSLIERFLGTKKKLSQ